MSDLELESARGAQNIAKFRTISRDESKSFSDALRHSNEAADRLVRVHHQAVFGAFLLGLGLGVALSWLVISTHAPAPVAVEKVNPGWINEPNIETAFAHRADAVPERTPLLDALARANAMSPEERKKFDSLFSDVPQQHQR